MNRVLQVAPGAAAERLDVYLARELGVSRTSVAAQVKSGFVTVNGDIARASQLLSGGEAVQVDVPEATVAPVVSRHLDLPIVFESSQIIVIDKPAGVIVHAGNGQPGPSVVDFARRYTTDPDPERPGIVHRLDKETSGLLVVARDAETKAWLQARWQEHAVRKTYLALVTGRLSPEAATINLPLGRDTARPTRRAVHPSGRPAVTHYQTLASCDGYTYVQARPETGRTHQLRVHFASTGHAIAGDVVYGPLTRPLGLTRHFLHAAALELPVPGGEVLHLASPLPTDLEAVLAGLGVQTGTQLG